MIQVLGHKAPDTDSTGSPLIWAWYLSEVRKTPAKAVLQGTPNTEAVWMLGRWGLDLPEVIADLAPGDQCVIVDTNNPAELPAGINDAEVIEIIDHHLLAGGIKTRLPINITIRPLACTATIMHDLIGGDLDRAPAWVKGVMLTCILSDTLEFRSPTTTPHDRWVAEKLAGELGLSIPEYATEMFSAKSDVSSFSDAALLKMDSKEYELGGKQMRISVLETTAPQVLLDRKAALLAAMPGVAAEDGADEVMLFIVDILNERSTLLVPNDFVRAVAAASFGVPVEGDSVILPGIVSRKKQIIPALKL
ncbi:manganese-dependent inorganic pyrophosphatase [Paracoccus sanguinis]|uniref:Manganese-dependent inorganic pyrophosphatase n=1 Tax=Paracoccus sanguinis TaxID=1545044 RepID=A0A1H2ZIN0_9RHOB|nr:manganese-dependent inorganic pyrophosphatase [Paracoccus sanguinis]KGJ18906.1 inorganic pyrophosphatase [Paracoccus sanguinis]SDX17266.1 manganese-dependent inorganic pyrophosphatase [Paracoccus sanguinis]